MHVLPTLADMISLEFLIVSGGVLLLVVGGVFFAIATFVAGMIKRRKRNRDDAPSVE